MRSLLVASSLVMVLGGCRRAGRRAHRPRVALLASRPDGVDVVVSVPVLRRVLSSLTASGIDPRTAARSLAGALPFGAAARACIDPTRGAAIAFAERASIVTLGLQSADEFASSLSRGDARREVTPQGVWFTPTADASAVAGGCLVHQTSRAWLSCGPRRGEVLRVAPWLATRVGGRDDAVVVEVRDGALGERSAAALRALTSWLAQEAARARAQRGAPTLGDPEPLIAAMRAHGATLSVGLGALRGLRATIRPVTDGLELLVDASGDAPSWSAPIDAGAPPGMRLEVPRRGVAIGIRSTPSSLRSVAGEGTSLVTEVLADRTPHGPALRSDVARWSIHLAGSMHLSIAPTRDAISGTMVFALDDARAAEVIASEARAAPWWPTSSLATRADGATLRVQLGATEHTRVTLQGAPTLALVARLGDSVAEGLTLSWSQRRSRVAIRAFLGARWVDLAMGVDDR